ncbi:toxin secretion, membrane fusion protein [Photobacterium leiognathi lrivu.4.1]|uniref:Toxin secretion, membrane fusion protein n=1 Tax=Photobacterium leiognathi lrivu.4.1 TaxID=1248232 RepID=V5H2T7_PHOLE|nr:HlyD family efflux transporter periplasmic adaptor subunit [Photobacterium leiognathi]GAD31392.1 toxin secretion, membrane fusion protein [Photobacterium leiognathi lrivu.4.1]
MFRNEVLEAKKQRLFGTVIVTQPMSIYAISLTCFIVFILIFIYLSQASYSRKETVNGYLTPEKGLVKVFSNRMGVIANIYVVEGEVIEQGKEIVKIKNSQSLTTGIELSTALSYELSLQIGYLEKELNTVVKVNEKELSRIKRQITQLNKSILALNNAKETNKKKIRLKENQLNNNQKLLQKGHISQSQIDLVTEQYLDSLEANDRLDREIANVNAEISTLRSEYISLPEQLTLKQIVINRQLSELKAQVTELDNQYEFTQKAPESGIVTAIQPSIGTRVDPNTPLLSIIPVDSPLEIELLLPTRSAGFVQIKDKINIRFDAFPYQKFGIVVGEISNIDKALILPTDRQLPIKFDEAMYRVRAKLHKQSVQAYGKEFPLKVGMIAEVDIILEKRSLLEWLLDPIYAVKGTLG